MKKDLRIALSTDAKGHPYHATLIASILRRTKFPVHVRCWCRGFLPESFESGPLKVEFISAEEEVTGKFPSQSGPAAYDRLRVIRDCEDWDRCMVMDHDQLALCDLAPLFELDLGDHLLAAHMQGPGVDMDYAMRVWLKRPIPEGWEHVAKHPYFLMPPLLNLKAMREAGTWETFLAAHAAFGADEQMSLTAATEGRSLPLEAKWNLCTKAHIAGDKVPEGVIHWSGWPKPWHRKAKVWRPDIWLSEQAGWEHLRMGIWQKPLAIEVEPEDDRGVKGLLGRGWRVEVCCGGSDGMTAADAAESLGLPDFPDLTIHGGGPAEFHALLQRAASPPDLVRLGPWAEPGEWLDGAAALPDYLALRGELLPEELVGICGLGYNATLRIKTREWPAGGPLPRALDYGPVEPAQGLQAGHEIYLRRDPAPPTGPGDRPSLERRRQRVRVAEPKKIGVLVTVDRARLARVGPWLRSVRRNFLPGHEVSVFLFTDGDYEEAADLRVIPVVAGAEPELARYGWFTAHAAALEGRDYLYHLDVNIRVQGAVGEEILGSLVGVEHPWYFNKTRRDFLYEPRQESSACVAPHEGDRYFYVRLQGGTRDAFLAASEVIAGRIEADRARGITARWKDEAHWNRYLIDHPPSLALSPAYCSFPGGCDGAFEPKIVIDGKS